MLKIATMPILLCIVSKLDTKPIVEKLKGLDVFKDTTNPQEALKQLTPEKAVIIATEIFSDITPQLAKIANDIPTLVAAYKSCTIDEAKELDAAEVINEIIHDEGILNFFKIALRKKVEQTA
ncbi:MAG: hypothetical protein A2Y17_12305 [Clostridiales bacterium GWF2_38_85]|nr:MAG: hypothetical protein A2Y17_12305 [Clostridiales bacterium GWF2_38_85]